jgi:hypothetical protein
MTAMASVVSSVSANEPKVCRNNIQIEHIRIDSDKSFGEVRAALEKLPKFDDRIRVLLHYGEIARVKAELEKIQGDAGLVIFSVATHGDWLQILSGKRHALQYVIGNVPAAAYRPAGVRASASRRVARRARSTRRPGFETTPAWGS